MKNCIKVRVLVPEHGWRDVRMKRDNSATDVPEKAYRPIPGRDTELMATARCALPVYELTSVENTVTDCAREFEVTEQFDVWPGNED